MINLTEAIRLTRNYAAYFHSYLDNEGLHHWLISGKTVPKRILIPFPQKLTHTQILDIKSHREISRIKIEKAKRITRFLSFFPTITLIAVTGSLAVDNAQKDDDLDFFIITHTDTLWLTRPLVILFLKVSSLRRPTSLPEHSSPVVSDKVCDNLWLDENALTLPKNKRNLYTAHEVLQAKPLFDRGNTYAKFVHANAWAKKYLANAYQIAMDKASAGVKQNRAQIPWQRPGMRARDLRTPNWLVKVLNHLAFRLQYSYMKSKITNETITLHSAYFHPNDYGLMKLDG